MGIFAHIPYFTEVLYFREGMPCHLLDVQLAGGMLHDTCQIMVVLLVNGIVDIIGVKVTPHDKTLLLSAADDMMRPITTALNEELLEKEQSTDGMCFGFAGSCPYCDGAPCARIEGEPCRHPDKVRPSLEAYGFDVSLTVKELLGIEIKWSEQGLLPEYLTLVGGVFY